MDLYHNLLHQTLLIGLYNNFLCDYCDVGSTIMINENNEIICNCNNVIGIMNNMDVVTAPLTDDNYEEMEINETCKIFFSNDF